MAFSNLASEPYPVFRQILTVVVGWVELHKTTKLKIFMRKRVLCYCECLESMEGSFLLNSAFDPSTLGMSPFLQPPCLPRRENPCLVGYLDLQAIVTMNHAISPFLVRYMTPGAPLHEPKKTSRPITEKINVRQNFL